MSCAAGISLNLIQIHSALNASVQDCGQLIYSCADDPEKCKYKKMKSSVHICDNASTRQVQPPKEPKVVKTDVAQWKNSVVHENRNQRYQVQDNIVYSGKISHEAKLVWPVRHPIHM